MFAKTAIFFVAFTAFVNAAPLSTLEPITTSDLRPLVPLTLPDVRYKLETIASKRDDAGAEFGADIGNNIGWAFGDGTELRLPLLKRDNGYQQMGSSGGGAGYQQMGSSGGGTFGQLANYFNSMRTGKRSPADDTVSQLIKGLNELQQNLNNIQRLGLLANGISAKRDDGYQEMGSSGGGYQEMGTPGGGYQEMGTSGGGSGSFGQLADFFNSMGKRDFSVDVGAVSQLISGLEELAQNVNTEAQRLQGLLANLQVARREVNPSTNKPSIAARDIVVDSRTLGQLQSFVVSTVNLLNALGKSDTVNTFLSEVDNLKAEARNGSLDIGDLLDAARDILRSVL